MLLQKRQPRRLIKNKRRADVDAVFTKKLNNDKGVVGYECNICQYVLYFLIDTTA